VVTQLHETQRANDDLRSKRACEDSTVSCSTTTKRLRAVEIGFLNVKSQFVFYIYFHHFPIWLLGLEVNFVQTIYIEKHPSFSDMLAHIQNHCGASMAQFTSFLVHRVGIQRFVFGSQGALAGIRLFSGPLTLMCKFLADHRANDVWAMVDSDFHGRLHQGQPTGIGDWRLDHVTWFRIRHASVGGGTSFCSLFARCGTVFVPRVSVLRRNIRSFFNFGIRPVPCNHVKLTSTSSAFYKIDDKLQAQFLYRPVLFQTHFSYTGWGVRSLTTHELAHAYGLPKVLAQRADLDDSLFRYPPVQILDAIIQGFLATDSTALPCSPTATVPPPLRLGSESLIQQSWIPSLGRYLSHEWIDTSLVTIKAIKHDNASAPSHLWDARMTLLFPGCAKALPTYNAFNFIAVTFD
jgi:hypothetical protein